MASRALIIAIEQYPATTGGMEETVLKGVVDSAKAFQDWLVEKWAKDKVTETQMLFCSNPVQPGGLEATAKEIRKALKKLVADGQGMTEEFFFYFGGHGFRFEKAMGDESDVLVGAGYDGDGDECIQLDEIVRWLSRHLGKGRQYFFIDACRNVLDRSKIVVSDSLPWGPKVSGEASSFIIQSTVAGRTAFADGGFSPLLMAGLKGGGKAKRWADDMTEGMKVTFSSLFDYLEQKLPADQSVDQKIFGSGLSKAVFAVFNPPDPAKITVSVQNLPSGQQALLTLTRTRTKDVSTSHFGDATTLNCPPDNYFLEVKAANLVVVPDGLQKVEIFEGEETFTFKVEPPNNIKPSNAVAATDNFESVVDFALPQGATLKIRGIDNAVQQVVSENEPQTTLPNGRYVTKLVSREGLTLRNAVLNVTPKSGSTLEHLGTGSIIHYQIAKKLPGLKFSPDFSETLGGGMDDPDPNVWLTLLGGGKIMGSDGRFSKINRFRLNDFSTLWPGDTGVYFLAAFDAPDASLCAAQGAGPEVNWIAAAPPDELSSLREVFIESQPGPQFVSLKINQYEPITIASCCIPNRITLFVITLDKGDPVINQFILPLGHLVPFLSLEVRVQLDYRNPLKDLKTLAQIARAFRTRRELRDQFKGHELDELLWAKWLDPVGAAMAAYELIRRGDERDLREVAHNLIKFFPEFPDGPAIASLAKHEAKLNGVPIFLDGWLAVRRLSDPSKVPAGTLNFNASLTTWSGAVKW